MPGECVVQIRLIVFDPVLKFIAGVIIHLIIPIVGLVIAHGLDLIQGIELVRDHTRAPRFNLARAHELVPKL